MASRGEFLSLLEKKHLDKPIINYFSTENTGLSILKSEFLSATEKLESLLLKLFGKKLEFIGVELNDYLWLPCVLISIWKLGKSCACIGTQYSKDCNSKFLNALGVQHIITDSDKCCFETACYVQSFEINDRRFHIWKLKSADVASKSILDICYGIMTSGSTGSPKIIQVPWSCIMPNIYELINLFCTNENDNVYLSSPYTFDPFFVELFMSLITSCTLTIVSPQLKMSPESLLKVLFQSQDCTFVDDFNMVNSDVSLTCKTSAVMKSSVTVIQMTPSILKRWNMIQIKDIILSEMSSLRILMLGGEKFPIELLKLKSSRNKTQIYNLYGITEISCWAFINRVTDNCSEVSLGAPLKGIAYFVDDNNELVIGSNNRICLIDGENYSKSDEIVYRKTGDLVKLNNSEMFYIGRTNQIVKKFGVKINLEKIEKKFLIHFNECYCVFDESTGKHALFYINDKFNGEYMIREREIVDNLRNIEVPDVIIEIPKTPLNSNGKCDKISLLKLFRDIMRKEQMGDVQEIFHSVWTRIIGKGSFLVAGGDSVKALQMVTSLEEAGIEISTNFLPTLLNGGDYTACLHCLRKNGNKKIKLETGFYKLSVLWSFDTKKCVDASPTIFHRDGEVHAVVGSHSSRLSSVKVDTGQENWTINLADRIESGFAVDKSSTYGVIGCYDRHVYYISTTDGDIIWKYKTGGMIKSTPCFSSNEELVYVASYDTFLYCLKRHDGTLIKRLKLSDRGIYSSGIASDKLNLFFIATLDGTCVSLSQESNEVMWKTRLTNPVFASPVEIVTDSNGISVIFTEVTGQLNCFDAQTGNKMWRYECSGCIYSTPVFSHNLLFFPCYDNNFYCVELSGEPSIKWKTQLDSSGFARACPISIGQHGLIATASTKGFIYLIHMDTGSIWGEIKLDGEIFSSPKINSQRLIVGCRDNNLYCIQISA